MSSVAGRRRFAAARTPFASRTGPGSLLTAPPGSLLTAHGYNAGDDRPEKDLGSVVQPADADLHLHRLQFRPATLAADQSPAGVVAFRKGRPHFARPVFIDATAVYLEISVVALARPVRAADARPPTRLDVDNADRAADLHPDVRPVRAEARSLGDCRSVGDRGFLFREPGHRARRVPARAPAGCRAWSWHIDPRSGVSRFEPRPGRAGAGARRPYPMARRIPDHRVVHAALHRQH